MKTDCMKILLDDYVGGRMRMHHQMNILLNSETNYLKEFGEHFYSSYKLSGKSDKNVDFFIKRIEDIKLKRFRPQRILSAYEDLTIFFLTSLLNEEMLFRMFGEGVKHSHFGEGFEDKREYKYISYMIELDDTVAHIGFDHRGTSVSFNTLDETKVCTMVMGLINLFIEKLNYD